MNLERGWRKIIRKEVGEDELRKEVGGDKLGRRLE